MSAIRRLLGALVTAGAVTAGPAYAQGPGSTGPASNQAIPQRQGTVPREAFVTIGSGSLVFNEADYGSWASVGGGIRLPFSPTSRFFGQLEVARMLGTEIETFTSRRRRCTGIGPTASCTPPEQFQYRSGTSSLVVASATVGFTFLRHPRVQAFVGGGVSLMSYRGMQMCSFCAGGQEDEDVRSDDTGPSVFLGARVPVGNRFSITPTLSGEGVYGRSVGRASIGIGYRF